MSYNHNQIGNNTHRELSTNVRSRAVGDSNYIYADWYSTPNEDLNTINIDERPTLPSMTSLSYATKQAYSTMGNMAFAPNQVKQQPNANPSLNIPYEYWLTYVVTDMEDVAKLYESLGYSVHEVVSSVSNWRTDPRWIIRYYYNVLTFDEINITLTGVPSDNATLDNIKTRFTSGLRLWSVLNNDTILPLGAVWQFDNVESAYIGD